MHVPDAQLKTFILDSGLVSRKDVEAAEKELLEGAKETLKITDTIFIEIIPVRKGPHNRDHIDVFEILHDAGFSLYGIHSDFLFTKL